MRPDIKRHVAPWILLAVYLPMLLVSSVHTHGTAQTADQEYVACTHHQCHGHIVSVAQSHDCILCQFLTLTIILATAYTLHVYAYTSNRRLPGCRYGAYAAYCRTITPRGPPAL